MAQSAPARCETDRGAGNPPPVTDREDEIMGWLRLVLPVAIPAGIAIVFCLIWAIVGWWRGTL